MGAHQHRAKTHELFFFCPQRASSAHHPHRRQMFVIAQRMSHPKKAPAAYTGQEPHIGFCPGMTGPDTALVGRPRRLLASPRPPLSTFVHPRPTCIPLHAGKALPGAVQGWRASTTVPTLFPLAASVASVQEEGLLPKETANTCTCAIRKQSTQLSWHRPHQQDVMRCAESSHHPCQRGSTSRDRAVVEIEAWWTAIMIKPAMASPAGHDDPSSSPTRWLSETTPKSTHQHT